MGTCRVTKVHAAKYTSKCILSFLLWGACKKPRYGYYTRHAAHYGHAPLFLEVPPQGNSVIVALYLVNRRGSPITPLTGHRLARTFF